MRARRTPITDAVADTAWDGASDDYSAYAKMLKNARELEEKLQAECRSAMKLTNELLDVKLELVVAKKQRDTLLKALQDAETMTRNLVTDARNKKLWHPLATSNLEQAANQMRAAIARAKGGTP